MAWEGCNGTRMPIHLCATSLGVQVKAGAGRQGRPLTQLQTELSAGFTKELHLICVGKELEKSKVVQSPGKVQGLPLGLAGGAQAGGYVAYRAPWPQGGP